MDLLFHLHRRPEARGVSELGRELGLPKSSVHRLLAALLRRGLVERDARGRYRPGVGLIALGLGALDRDPVVAVARPVIEEAASALGETVFLTAARAGAVVVLDKAEGTGFLRAAPRVGTTVPLHATAVGRLYLAHAPEQVQVPRPPLPFFTDRTPRSSETLEREVRRAREQGFAENRGEWIPGLAVIAVPVRAGGRMVAALAVAASEARMEPALRRAALRRMQEAAARVGARLDGEETPGGVLR